MTQLTVLDASDQAPMPTEPYDRWVSPNGDCMAEFHRTSAGFLVRFPGEADFVIDPKSDRASGRPAPGMDAGHVRKLFGNSIVPLIGNYKGGLFLHGSAVVIDGEAIGFLGLSRSGKTTLAGAFAKSGYAYLTEDVIDIEKAQGVYRVRPVKSALRLFHDSAEFLLGPGQSDRGEKMPYDCGDRLPFSAEAVPLASLYILGSDMDADLAIERCTEVAALANLMKHAFVLDVEDRARVAAHFARLADLAEEAPVYMLDYPRSYSALPNVLSAVLAVQLGTNQA